MRLYSRRLQNLRTRILTLALIILLLTLLLPYDNSLVLLIRWHLHSLRTIFSSPSSSQFNTRPLFPLDLTTDVGIIVKTGYATQDRLAARLAAFEPARDPSNLVLVGDYSTAVGAHFELPNSSGDARKRTIPVHNALAAMIGSGALLARPRAQRLLYYWNLTEALANGDEQRAGEIGREYGWELDIMKHVSGLEIGHRTMPRKKWYILLDDDTYLINSSLELILQHLDPSEPHYLGNAVGDYRARFAHGGSAVVLSHAAMRRLFVSSPQIVAAAHMESLDASWGDKLIATTAMKTGVYLNEDYVRYFNGEPPRATRIRADRFCAPLVSFHKMPPAEMTEVARTFGVPHAPAVAWLDVWRIYHAPPFDMFLDDPVRPDWDHVGKLDEETMTTKDVKTAAACVNICNRRAGMCLAWTWDADARLCHLSPWMIVGEAAKGRSSGINARRVARLAAKCV